MFRFHFIKTLTIIKNYEWIHGFKTSLCVFVFFFINDPSPKTKVAVLPKHESVTPTLVIKKNFRPCEFNQVQPWVSLSTTICWFMFWLDTNALWLILTYNGMDIKRKRRIQPYWWWCIICTFKIVSGCMRTGQEIKFVLRKIKLYARDVSVN